MKLRSNASRRRALLVLTLFGLSVSAVQSAYAQNGIRGTGHVADEQSLAVQIPGVRGLTSLAAGSAHDLAIKSDGTIYAWGDNGSGQLGNGSTNSSATPIPIPGVTGAVSVAAGESFSLAVQSDGTVWAWGYNGWGQLGEGTTNDKLTPVPVVGLTGVKLVGAGQSHSIALKTDGTVWTWGDNAYSDLGHGTDLFRSTPVQMLYSGNTTAIAAGGNDTLVVSTDPDPHFTPLARHDIVWQDTSSADLLISPWSAKLPLIPTPATATFLVRHIQSGWKIVATPDLDDDGQPDILWENNITGDVTYWIMDGMNLRNAGSVAQGVDLAWQIVGAPDINGDGRPDILWQNTQTGDVVYW